ncbi:MAG: long-chain-fatty-acid--CoA ligase [Deltaproteobacteria bacterium]|nr:long-chain-fatty-acid--CoA ligase [Deltaproteobacteria bacterium]
MNIPFILEKAVSLYPHKEAVVCGDKRFTYKQFENRVFALARAFHAMGIQKGDRIAILHPNSHQYMETYFGTARLGAILNPLNVRLSPQELTFIIRDSGARLLIAASRYQDSVHSSLVADTPITHIVWTGKRHEEAGFESMGYEDLIQANQDGSKLPEIPISDEDIAHLYYTSGTTGLPKGVMLSHKNVCVHALAAIAELRLGDHDHWIHVAPLFHLADAWATFAVTWVGGKHVLIPDFDPLHILSAIQKEKITITNMVPTMLNTLIHTKGVESVDVSSLRAILSGGAPIAPELVKKIMETFKCDYLQTYGMTETSPYLTVSILKENLRNLSQEEQFQYKSKTGRPFLGVLLKVIRENGTEIDADDKEVGEIIVKGDIVTRGYWNRPEETDEAIKDGWLHTGDMAVLDKEGYVNIVDRKKDVIITGGENVYSIEVENILYSHPAILEAAVIGLPDPKWGEAVKAVVVLKPGCKAEAEGIIEFCKARIAGYKAPKSVDFVTDLPRTGSGKIHKKKIREWFKGEG